MSHLTQDKKVNHRVLSIKSRHFATIYCLKVLNEDDILRLSVVLKLKDSAAIVKAEAVLDECMTGTAEFKLTDSIFVNLLNSIYK